MHAIVIDEHGGPEVLRYTETPDPKPGPEQVLVEVAACGVNFIDVYYRTGAYPAQLPLVLGMEGAGTVREIGEGRTDLAVGDRVAWPFTIGSYAELAVLPAAAVVAVPGGIDDRTAAGCMVQGLTAHYLTNSTYAVQAGDAVLVHAAAGGTGQLLCQVIAAKGGRVIGTVSTDEKERVARAAGAAEIIRYDRMSDLAEIAERVKDLTGGTGVPVVYDGVGRSTFEASLASLRRRGTMVLFGAASGPVPPFDPQRLNAAGSLFLTRPMLGHYLADRDELRWRATDVFSMVADGTLRIPIEHDYPLADAAQAHTDLEGRRTTGKLVLTP